MRKALVGLTAVAFALGAFAAVDTVSAAAAKMSKMGCVIGKQKYDASAGKCMDATPVKKVSKKVMKKAA